MVHETEIAHTDTRPALPSIRRITIADLWDALGKGFHDFSANPSFAVLLAVIYPIIGLLLGRLAFGYDVLPLLFPLVAGFALIGPIAAIGFYELSRRREQGVEVSWTDTLGVFQSHSVGPIVTLGLGLMLVFLVWLAIADAIYVQIFGYTTPPSIEAFARQILATPSGSRLIIVGNAVGFFFALLVFVISVVSFPLLLDRNVGASTAIVTSVRAVLANPLTMAVWGLIIAVALVIGAIPFFFGLAVVLPVLGHSTWHVYRKVVGP